RRIQFLVDSGADVSIIPPQAKSKIIKMSDFKLYAANGTEIPTFGVHVLNINLGLRRDFRWPFIIAKVNRGILGADFLHHFDLIVDLKNKQLIDGKTKLGVSGNIISVNTNNSISTVSKSHKFSELLNSYPNLTKPNLLPIGVKHDVKHQIITTGLILMEYS
ncbi:hypothetical protein ACUWCL_28210, partial [Klebsiella pneumoniae]|uniref:hypothetical protein n=1 Tax=Klebsiella pneumoniae TaxID=573 RepID=UPI004055967A